MVCTSCMAAASAPALSRHEAFQARVEGAALAVRLRAVDIPHQLQDATFENFVADTPRAERIAGALSTYSRDFEQQRAKRSGFLFLGPQGTGKTHLACALMTNVVACGYSARYVTLPSFSREMRARFHRPADAAAYFEALVQADVLCLDEIDLHAPGDRDYAELYDLINRRYERPGYPVIAISNRDLDRLTVDLDERLISRLLGGTKPLVFDWPGRRELPMAQRRKPAAAAGGAR